MPSVYYTNIGKEVVAGDVALASDLNSVNDDTDYGFAQVAEDITNIEYLSPYYSALAQKWAENPENVEVVPGSYSALHWAAKADADAIQTAADRVQTGLDAASAFDDAVAADLSADAALISEQNAADSAAIFTPTNILNDLITVDGTGSGLDADLLDGEHSTYFYYKSNILGTVSQSGKVPTGAIIERGSNSNGEYVRFADGTQICVISIADSTGSYTWTYPAAFIAIPIIASQAIYSSDTTFVLSGYSGLSASNAIIKTFNVSAGSITLRLTSIVLRILTIGRWF